MSRGPGRIERAIRALFDAHPDGAFTTWELAAHCYPEAQAIERKHEVAVLRAAWHVIEADPRWCAISLWRRGRGWVFCNTESLASYGRACLRHDARWRGRTEAENEAQLAKEIADPLHLAALTGGFAKLAGNDKCY